jgi:DNA-binding transcriptional regulator YhcF (GntR family)
MKLAENDSTSMLQQNVTEYIPTESEQKLIDILLNPDYRMKSVKELCIIAQINRVTYYRAFEKPEFKTLYKAKSRELVDNSIAPVLNTFVREALRGSFQHGKVILEMAGLYSEKSQLEVTGEINVNMSQNEIRARIASLLSSKQLDSAIPVDYTIIKDDSATDED